MSDNAENDRATVRVQVGGHQFIGVPIALATIRNALMLMLMLKQPTKLPRARTPGTPAGSSRHRLAPHTPNGETLSGDLRAFHCSPECSRTSEPRAPVPAAGRGCRRASAPSR